jgi:Phage integrase family
VDLRSSRRQGLPLDEPWANVKLNAIELAADEEGRKPGGSWRVVPLVVQKQARKRWQEHDLEPIGLHEARHTAATWLDHAGVSPKVVSQLMGHKTPE